MTEYELVARKRDWVPEWLWRIFCLGNIAIHQPFRWVLTVRYSRPRLVYKHDL